MQKLAHQILLISILFVFTACGTYQPKNVVLTTTKSKNYINPYFSDITQDYVYKTSIEVFGNKLGGVFVIKKIDNQKHRVVLTTNFGNKLIDFEVSPTAFTVNFIIEALENKRLLKILETDFRLLLYPSYLVDKTFTGENQVVYAGKQNKGTVFLHINKTKNFLYKLSFTKKSKEKITFEFEEEKDTFVGKLIISHHNLPILIKMIKI
ncbi:hypothetical protein GGR32_000259 [Mesonia hippocampi]|uniref:Lipoprotein n=1 Tax=Mesonia hippocampi TaxID=1628250 RepID=A0A840ESS8_9FLAO|nr:hypothetical protein [Mesonia hippocampi]MBB4117987.1 hypothetical protein [Mesonia hippocampi]